MRWIFIASGAFLSVLWFACSATTVVPGSTAVTQQQIGNIVLPFLAGIAFVAGACWRKK